VTDRNSLGHFLLETEHEEYFEEGEERREHERLEEGLEQRRTAALEDQVSRVDLCVPCQDVQRQRDPERVGRLVRERIREVVHEEKENVVEQLWS